MNLNVSTSNEVHEWELGGVPLMHSISVNAASISLIYQYIASIEDKEWLNHATNLAMGEMISDVDEVLKEAKAVLEAARKQIPFRYRYFINPLNSWLQKLK